MDGYGGKRGVSAGSAGEETGFLGCVFPTAQWMGWMGLAANRVKDGVLCVFLVGLRKHLHGAAFYLSFVWFLVPIFLCFTLFSFV